MIAKEKLGVFFSQYFMSNLIIRRFFDEIINGLPQQSREIRIEESESCQQPAASASSTLTPRTLHYTDTETLTASIHLFHFETLSLCSISTELLPVQVGIRSTCETLWNSGMKRNPPNDNCKINYWNLWNVPTGSRLRIPGVRCGVKYSCPILPSDSFFFYWKGQKMETLSVPVVFCLGWGRGSCRRLPAVFLLLLSLTEGRKEGRDQSQVIVGECGTRQTCRVFLPYLSYLSDHFPLKSKVVMIVLLIGVENTFFLPTIWIVWNKTTVTVTPMQWHPPRGRGGGGN